jgi:hypothetical protein
VGCTSQSNFRAFAYAVLLPGTLFLHPVNSCSAFRAQVITTSLASSRGLHCTVSVFMNHSSVSAESYSLLCLSQKTTAERAIVTVISVASAFLPGPCHSCHLVSWSPLTVLTSLVPIATCAPHLGSLRPYLGFQCLLPLRMTRRTSP